MKKILLALVAVAALAVPLCSAGAQRDPLVGGAPMYASKTIVENASTAPNLSTLVAAVKAAGLTETLSGPGPFTVFAPTNNAFAKLPAGTIDNLLKPEEKDTLSRILTYHVVPGRITSKELMRMVKKGGGKTTLKTIQGEELTAFLIGGTILIADAKGGTANITTADVFQSNGVVHVTDAVLLP